MVASDPATSDQGAVSGVASGAAGGGDVEQPKEAGPLAEAEEKVKAMEDMEDYYFGSDKDAELAKALAEVTDCVDGVLAGLSRTSKLRPRALFLKGRAAAFVAGKERQAEELLSKAIKLDPLLLDAWNALGEVYWNILDVAQAKQCFEQALEMCGANAVSLRNLSMALRALGGGETGKEDGGAAKAQRADNYAKALARAKEALALDTSDPESWETLGNAYVGDFFVNVKRPDDIFKGLIAYEKAEGLYDKLGKRNPSLFLNRGMAAKYIQDYDVALRSFQKAHEMGSTTAAQEGKLVLELVQRLANQVERKCDFRAKRLKEFSADFPAESRGLRQLEAGEGDAQPLAARLVAIVDRKDEVPVILVACDAAGDFFALAVYHADLRRLAKAVVPTKSILQIQQPKLRQISLAIPAGKTIAYPCVLVGHPRDASVVGGGSLASAAATTEVFCFGADRAAPPPTATEQAAHSPTPASAKAASPATSPSSRRRRRGNASSQPGKSLEEVFAECKAELHKASADAGRRGLGRAAIIKAVVPAVRRLIESDLGPGTGGRIGRVETMLARMGRGEVYTSESEQDGKRYAPGYVEGLEPGTPFLEEPPWVATLNARWPAIRDELRENLERSGVWEDGAYAKSNNAYAKDWRISGVLKEDQWVGPWKVTRRAIEELKGVVPFEAFFARMPPHSSIGAHSDKLNYILTSSLGVDLESGLSTIQVGNDEREWEEGQTLVFDTSYIHSAFNDSGRNRYVLVFRFWHPDLTPEERRAIQFVQALIAGVPDPESAKVGAPEAPIWASPSEQP